MVSRSEQEMNAAITQLETAANSLAARTTDVERLIKELMDQKIVGRLETAENNITSTGQALDDTRKTLDDKVAPAVQLAQDLQTGLKDMHDAFAKV